MTKKNLPTFWFTPQSHGAFASERSMKSGWAITCLYSSFCSSDGSQKTIRSTFLGRSSASSTSFVRRRYSSLNILERSVDLCSPKATASESASEDLTTKKQQVRLHPTQQADLIQKRQRTLPARSVCRSRFRSPSTNRNGPWQLCPLRYTIPYVGSASQYQ